MAVYLASDRPLPLIPWDEEHPGFHVTGLSQWDELVREQFSRPHVYSLGAYRGCGCEFQYGQSGEVEADDPAEWAAAQEARRRLAAYLGAALEHQPEVDLFACWGGDVTTEVEHRGRLRLGDLFRDRVGFRDREFLTVERSTSTS